MSKLYAYHFARFLKENPFLTEITTKQFIEYLDKSDQPELAANYLGVNRLYNMLCGEGILEKSPKSNHRNVKYYKVVNLENEREVPESEIMLRTMLLSYLGEIDHGYFSVKDRHATDKDLRGILGIDQQNNVMQWVQHIRWSDNPLNFANDQLVVLLQVLQQKSGRNNDFTLQGCRLTCQLGSNDMSVDVFPFEIQTRNNRLVVACLNESCEWMWVPVSSVVSVVTNNTRLELTSSEYTDLLYINITHVNPPLFDWVTINTDTLVNVTIQFDESAWDRMPFYIGSLEHDYDPDRRTITIEHIDDIHLANWIQSIGGKRI